MPQLETATYISQFFWLIVCFISLWGMMSLFIVPKIENILEQRRLKIDDYVQKAEELNKEALQSLEKYEKAIAKARENADEMLSKNKIALEKNVAEKRLEMEQKLSQKIAENEKSIEMKRQEIMEHIDALSLNLAQEILKKLDVGAVKISDLEKYSSKENHGAKRK